MLDPGGNNSDKVHVNVRTNVLEASDWPREESGRGKRRRVLLSKSLSHFYLKKSTSAAGEQWQIRVFI